MSGGASVGSWIIRTERTERTEEMVTHGPGSSTTPLSDNLDANKHSLLACFAAEQAQFQRLPCAIAGRPCSSDDLMICGRARTPR